MDWRRFVAAVFAGRLIRFLGEAYLAVKLGNRAAETVKEHYPSIAGALAVAAVVYLLLRQFGSQPMVDLDRSSSATGSVDVTVIRRFWSCRR